YDLCGNMLTYKDSTGNIYSYQYDALNRKIQVTNPDSTTKSITFDSNNFITSITDENLNTVSYTYNESDNLESFTDAESNVTQFEYDSQGRLISETDPKGFVYRYEYDVRNRLTKKIFPDNSFIKYEYAVQSNSKVSDAYGSRPVAMTDQMGNRGQIQYNELYARTSAINPAGYKTTRVWDGLDRVKEIIDENNRSTKFTYNNIYKLTSIENALGYKKLFNYDSMGNLSSFTDEESNTSRFYYNSFYQKSSETNALGKTVTYSRNANGYTTSITDPKNNAISYQYDSRNRVIKTTDSLNNQTQYFYDNTNNVIKLVRADNTEVLFEYYKTGLLKSVTYPDNQTVSFEYDENLNLTRMTDWTGESLYAYNNLNQLIEEIKPDGNKIQYQYNLNGVKTQLKLVDSNNIELYKIDYTIDNMNRVTKIADGNNTGVQFAYEPGGKRVSEIYSNGINTSYLYNTLNQLTQIKSVNSSQGILSKFDYTFDKAGNIKSETSESGLIKNYSYDAIYQLTGVNYSNAEYINYSFDDAGNRLTQNKNGVISNYSYNNLNQLTQLIESGIQTNYFYDLNGNLISETAPGKTVKYAYNFMNKVQSITKTGTENISLAMNYNGFGDRVSKTYSDGKSYGYIYNGNNVLAESSNQYLGNKAYYMTGGIDEIFARTINNAPEFYLIDNLNSLRKVVDGTHAIVNSIDYKPFGEVLSGNAGSHNYLYTGREKDFADIYYYRARTYSPLSGRFQQKDPIGAEGGLNLYRYCGNNSVNWVDPLGLDVTGFFNRPQGELTISDNDTGESVTVSAFSGHGTNTNNPASEGEKGKGPIPEGQYTIKEDSQNRDGWFELDANDSNPGNDIHDPTNRGQFRLHEGSISLGCITVVKGQEGWQEILDILKNTDRDLWDQIITGEYGELWVK
ncbi:MAG: YD repeat protein, partial [uncultured bacterium]